MNVPLMWGAAGEEQTIPVLDWLVATTTDMDGAVEFHDGAISPVDAVRSGWS